jgi:hypothetical protein
MKRKPKEREGKWMSTVETRRAREKDQGKNEKKTEEKKAFHGQPSITIIFIFKCSNR